MARLRDIIQRGLRSAQPVATAVDVGTLYYVTDEALTEQSDGTNWVAFGRDYVITFSIKEAVLGTGVKGFLSIPITGTITKVRLLTNNGSGSLVIDIWKDTFANFPPTVADTITASAKPTVSTDDNYEDSTLTGWTTAVVAGECLGYNVDSVTSTTQFTLELTVSVP